MDCILDNVLIESGDSDGQGEGKAPLGPRKYGVVKVELQ